MEYKLDADTALEVTEIKFNQAKADLEAAQKQLRAAEEKFNRYSLLLIDARAYAKYGKKESSK